MSNRWTHSRLFWSGIAGLMLLLWVWFGNPGKVRHLALVTRSSVYLVGWGGGKVGAGIYQRGITESRIHPPFTFIPPEFETSDTAVDPDNPRQVLATDPGRWYLPLPTAEVIAPTWFLMAGYLCTWLGGTAVWQRRKLRLTMRTVRGNLPVLPSVPES